MRMLLIVAGFRNCPTKDRVWLSSARSYPNLEGMIASFREESGPVTYAADVAAAVWQAATDPNAPLKIPAGEDAVQWMTEAT